MKKCLALGVIILLIFVFAGCDSGPEEEEYTLEISVVGNGSVSVDGVEIDDDETETFNYDETTSVPLEVSPDDDYIADWSGDTDKITDEGDILVDGDVSLTVTFQVDAETLKVINSIDADQVKRTAAITDDLVIVPGGEKLRALDKDNMEEEWSYDAGSEITTSPLVDEDGVIYIGTADEVIAVDDGEEKWDENPDIGNFSNTDSGFALVLADESSGGSAEIIVGSNDKDLYAVDADNGNQSWEEDVDASVLNNPAVDSDRGAVYVAAGEKVVAYDLETRDEEWTVDAEDIAEEDNIDTEDFDINEASPAVGEDMLYVASFEGTLYALDLENDGKVEWSYDTEGKISASPVIGTDETVYLGSGNDEGDAGTFHAVRDGEAEWKIDIDASVNTTAAVTGDGEIYFGDSKGTFYMVDAEEKANEEKVKEKQELDGTIESGVTVDDDGTIYVGCDGNREELSFYSLAGDSGLADSPWPKIGADLRNTSRKQ